MPKAELSTLPEPELSTLLRHTCEPRVGRRGCRVTMRYPMPPDRRRLLVAAILSTLLAVAWPAPSHCQSATTGALAGAVTDPGGAALPHVTVTLTNSATMATQTASTGGDGGYTFSLLSPGAYAVQFAASGFKTALMSSVAVNVGEAPTLDAALERGEAAEPVPCQCKITVTTS